MAIEEREVQCIVKPGDHFNEHERIQKIGGWLRPPTASLFYDKDARATPWSMTEDEAILRIEMQTMAFFTMVNKVRADVKVAGGKGLLGRKYLTTHPDDFRANNLLYLPECGM